MPSGAITITPGKQLAPGELVNNAKLNAIGRPTGRVNAGAIGARELDDATNLAIEAAGGRNLLCNGNFDLHDYQLTGSVPLTGVIAGGFNHDFGAVNRWVTANDANRVASVGIFAAGQTDVPDSPSSYLRWVQTSALSINPAYFGQRLENVTRFSGRKVTFSIWVRADASLSVTPKVRQFFGGGAGSADVITSGTVAALVGGVWTKITAIFDVPSLAGITIGSNLNFTEFRIDVPQAVAFQIDFAHAQVELGGKASRFDPTAIHEEVAFALRYYEVLYVSLSQNFTQWTPMWRTRTVMARQPDLTLFPVSSTGATIGNFGTSIVQTAIHTAQSNAKIVANAELYG
jgi:hypothetical protein